MQRHQNVVSWSMVSLIIANIFVPIAIVVFATGFFPYKPVLPGLASYEAFDYGAPPDAPFDRLVFMVVDALRSDFVYLNGTGFEYTQRLIVDGVAIPFTAHATSPTVTMPRIKAMTTGGIPSFLDVILNVDEGDKSSALSTQDTWLAQMKAKQTGKMLLYGDDTWLKLFPDTFDRADGTSSFFVSDFTEVDNNVTRHISEELRNEDWNTMVLHYLGLDHIGHKSGPRSSNMPPKQKEMDGIVREIYEALDSQPHLGSTLLVLCGDHGMNDAGNHGASSAGETSPALVFISPKLKRVSKQLQVQTSVREDFQYYSVVEQSDLAPTLGALLGFPVPKNNLGAFIEDFLPFWPEKRDQVQLLMRNARQILEIVTATFGSSFFAVDTSDCSKSRSDAEELACEWYHINNTATTMLAGDSIHEEWTSQMFKWLSKAQGLISSMASNYDMSRLVTGGALAGLALTFAIFATGSSLQGIDISIVPFTLVNLLYGFMMFASSYVEEEHHFWYWSATAWLIYAALKKMPRITLASLSGVIVVLLAIRLIRGWNQTGQKFAGEPDLVKIFLAPYPQLLWCLIMATYVVVLIQLLVSFSSLPIAISGPLATTLAIVAFSFKLAFTNEDAPELVAGFAIQALGFIAGPSLVTLARRVFMGLGLASVYPVYVVFTTSLDKERRRSMQSLHHIFTLLALTQSRATNIPLFLLFNVLYAFLEYLDLNVVEISTTSLVLQFASFFAMGGTNAISSVDLSNAYNGISGFNVGAVGILIFISNWAGPVWWTSATNLLLLQNAARKPDSKADGSKASSTFHQHASLITIFVTSSLCFIMAACTALRTHLFIWTVFSPKYLYSMAWSLGQHISVNIGFGGLLYWLGSQTAPR